MNYNFTTIYILILILCVSSIFNSLSINRLLKKDKENPKKKEQKKDFVVGDKILFRNVRVEYNFTTFRVNVEGYIEEMTSEYIKVNALSVTDPPDSSYLSKFSPATIMSLVKDKWIPRNDDSDIGIITDTAMARDSKIDDVLKS